MYVPFSPSQVDFWVCLHSSECPAHTRGGQDNGKDNYYGEVYRATAAPYLIRDFVGWPLAPVDMTVAGTGFGLPVTPFTRPCSEILTLHKCKQLIIRRQYVYDRLLWGDQPCHCQTTASRISAVVATARNPIPIPTTTQNSQSVRRLVSFWPAGVSDFIAISLRTSATSAFVARCS